MTDWADAPLTETADAIARGTVTSREVTEACLDRVTRLDTTLNSFVAVDHDAAITAAEARDTQMKDGAPCGPLHGVPLAHKDMYYREGQISACGSHLLDHTPAAETATALTRLDQAGAIDIGRLVMVEFALGPHGYNAHYPLCRNPWQTDHIPCGSSSGSGVAVRAGMVHAALGSDTGGSIRCPAAVTGLAGLLPTRGRVSRAGAMPMSFSLDVVGPLARRVRDCARLLSVIAGRDADDATTLNAPVPDYEAAIDAPGRLPRIGIAHGYFDDTLHPEVAAALDEAAATYRRLGFEVREIVVPARDLAEISQLHPLVMKAEGAANHMNRLRAYPEGYSEEVGNRLQSGFFVPATDYIQALKLRGDYLRRFTNAVFDKVDLLMTPVLPMPVPSIAQTTGNQGAAYLDMVAKLTHNTKIVNYLGLPAISVPCGFTGNGLPTAFQLIGRPLAEPALLATAERYEQATDWHRCLPAILG